MHFPFFFCILSSAVYGKEAEAGNGKELPLSQVYLLASESGKGGGWFGALLAMGIGSVLGTVGGYLVLAVLLVICVVCITEKSVVNAVKRGGGKAYRYAREDVDRRRVLHEERKEERRRMREEKRVRGVNLDSTQLWMPEEEEVQTDGDGLDFSVEEGSQPMTADPAMAYTDMPEEAGDSCSAADQADVFTGNIQMPKAYIDETDDTVPFDTEEPAKVLAAGAAVEANPVSAEGPASVFVEEDREIAYTRETEDGGTFSIPEGTKRVVTASGKIIETDTEALQKKLETKRQEAREAGDLPIARQLQDKPAVKKEYKFPPLSLLNRGTRNTGSFSEKEYRETAIKLQQTLRNFGVGVTVTNVSCGPSVTRYELHPEQGVKVSKIVGLADDIKLNLAAADIRIEAPIPGKAAVGIEVPNKENNTVYFRDLLEADAFQDSKSPLTFAVGKDIGGQTVVADIAKMPHLLIAGATGSGKSVCINTLIMSIIPRDDRGD